MALANSMWAGKLVLILALASSSAGDTDRWSPVRLHGGGSHYSLDAALTVGEGGRAGGGVRLRGVLAVTPLQGQGLLMLELVDTIVEQQWGTDEWKKVGNIGGVWGAGWDGENVTAWLDPGEEGAVRNVRRGMGMLLGMGDTSGGTDYVRGPGGQCGVSSQESDGHTRRAVLRCTDGVARVVRYTRGDTGRLQSLAAEEVLSAPVPTVRARSWLRLTRLPHTGSTAPDALPAHLTPHDILAESTPTEAERDGNNVEQLKRIVKRLAAAEKAGKGGTAELAGAMQGLGDAVRTAGGKRLKDLVSSCSPSSLGSLLFALGLSGCAAAMAAADSALQLTTDAAADLAQHYFRGLALALTPQDEVILWALETGEAARDERVRAAAILGASSAVGRGSEGVRETALQRLLKGLARCAADNAGSDCRPVYLRALGALHHAGAIPALLEHAARADPRAAMAALSTLAALRPPLRPSALPLLRLALDTPPLGAPRPLELRAAALILGTRLSAAHSPAALAAAARALSTLQDPLAGELRRLYWQVLEQLTAIPAVADMLKNLPADILAQHMYALNGTSGSVHRVAWSGGEWQAAMTADTASAGGLLRQQVVTVTATQQGQGASTALLSVAVTARGLHSLAGQEAPLGAEPEEEAEAAIAMTVLGAPLPPLTLFSGQAALLGALWSGTGSEPTPVLRASALLRDERLAAALLLGWVEITSRAGIALALDGSGVASLWSRTARAALELRAAVSANSTAIARTAWDTLAASSSASAAPSLSIAADLDFYAAPLLCVRANTPDYTLHSNSTVMTSRGSRSRFVVTSRAARSLALTKDIHAACRATVATDDE